MFEIREEPNGAFSVWAAGRERIALLRSQDAAEALMDALEDAWDEVFMRAVAETQIEHGEDFIDPMPPAGSH
ncbi:hypothetical protein [Roseomonas marmotae]|uniref:DUF1902 domain-containing protein n=1 Tax=Roseomonas marmotae TaxID=2768161 RepID=A0ABS3KBE0_9PROT|nr:hypothetical protein [Roseomonas marmotae]MBO1074788.1 hypothetical protein [Roseomonas marmotae]QTI80703.1 hypothetical protein IAI58_08260 [Roseomonas marmotae]